MDVSQPDQVHEAASPHNRPALVREAHARDAEAERAARPWREVVGRRLGWMLVLLACWTAVILARLVQLQVLKHDDYRSFVAAQLADTEILPGLRGRIVDRHGTTLAVTVQRDRIVASPKVLHELAAKIPPAEVADRVCAAIAGCDAAARARMRAALLDRPASQYALLWRDASPADSRAIRDLRLRGIYIEPESRRFYPNRHLAAHVIGHVDDRLRGLTGVERSHDADIRGRDGKRLVFRDGRRQGFDSAEERPATMGAGLELTIDSTIQLLAEEALAWGVREHRARGGVAVVADPHTGEVLASASLPTFNPNAFTPDTIGNDRDRAAQDIYEPGSTFKIVTAAAALETGRLGVESMVDVHGGVIRIGSRVVRDVHAYSGSLPLRDVIVKSSNVGAIRIGRAVGARTLASFAHAFGFGWLRVRDLPFASRGAILGPADPWSESALASVSMGYQVGVTPMQMVAAVSALANGGVLYEPHVVRAVLVGRERRATPIRAVHRVVAPETAARMTAIMEGVVERGTARAARIDGFTIAGKTGTARKAAVGRRGYTDEYYASFVGFVPSRDPVFTILVVIDAPRAKGYYGGAVAAPVFKRLAEAALRYRGIAPNVDPTAVERVLVASREGGTTGGSDPARAVATAATGTATPRMVDATVPGTMPDLRALSAREAVRRLGRLGVSVRLAGHGVVVAQDIAPGTPLTDGTICHLTLDVGRRLAVEAGGVQ